MPSFLTLAGDRVGELFQFGDKEAVQVVGVGVEAAGQLHRRVEPVARKTGG